MIAAEVSPITVVMGGVKWHCDFPNEDHYIEVTPGHSDLALTHLLDKIEELGLELMDEDECPATIDADGNVRTYLAEVTP